MEFFGYRNLVAYQKAKEVEVMSQIEVAEEEQYITTEQFHNIEILIADTARLLSGLQKSYITPSENSQQ